MTGFRGTRWALPVLIGVFPVGCRESEPPPRYYQDLGTEERPLLPTSTTWNDPRLLPGQSEWHPFREPTLDSESAPSAAAPASPEGAPAGAELEAEIRGVIEEHNERLAAGEFAELGEFYHADQAEAVINLAETFAMLSGKLRELAESLPEERERLERLAVRQSPKTILQINSAGIESRGSKAALVKLDVSSNMQLPPNVDPSQISFDLDFSLGEDGYWYIKSPLVQMLSGSLPMMETAASQMDGLIAGAKAGGESAASAREAVAAMLQMLDPGDSDQ